jgi:Binding-prot-dependent transport system membrane comp, N-term
MCIPLVNTATLTWMGRRITGGPVGVPGAFYTAVGGLRGSALSHPGGTEMPRLLVGRLAGLLLTLAASSFLIFSSLYLAPGDPVATLSGGRALPPEAVQALRHQHHLDDPFLTRYLSWLGDLAHGDPGQSFTFNTGVADLIAARAASTTLLVAMASVLIVGLGVTLGLVAGIRGGLLDTGVLLATVIGQAVPGFVAAIALIWLFAVQLGWLPAIGSGQGAGRSRPASRPPGRRPGARPARLRRPDHQGRGPRRAGPRARRDGSGQGALAVADRPPPCRPQRADPDRHRLRADRGRPAGHHGGGRAGVRPRRASARCWSRRSSARTSRSCRRSRSSW